MLKSNGCVGIVIVRFCFFRISHGRRKVEDRSYTICACHGFIQSDNEGSQFDELHNNLSHVVIKGNDLSLL